MRRSGRGAELWQITFVVANGIGQLAQLALLIAVTRLYGAIGAGELSLGLLAYTVISALSTNGLAVYGARLAGGHSARLPIGEIAVIRTAVAAVMGAVVIVNASRLAGEEGSVVAAFAAAAVSPMLIPEWLLLADHRLDLYSLETIGVRAVPAAAALWQILAGASLAAAAATYTIVAVAMTAVTLVGLRRRIVARAARPSVERLVGVVRAALPLGAGSLLSLLLLSGDSLAVRLLLGTESLGVYSTASRPISALMSAIGLYVHATFPRAVATVDSPRAFRSVIRSTVIVVLAPLLVLVTLAAIGAPQLMRFVYGAGVSNETATVFRLYGAVVVLFAIGTIQLTLVLLPRRRDRSYFGATVCGVATLLLAAPVLVALFGVAGAAGSAVLGNFAVAFVGVRAAISSRERPEAPWSSADGPSGTREPLLPQPPSQP